MFFRHFETIVPADLSAHIAGDEKGSQIWFSLFHGEGKVTAISTGQSDIGNQEIDSISIPFKHPQGIMIGSRYQDSVIFAMQNAANLFTVSLFIINKQ